MAMAFKDVTDIRTDFGNLIKIQDAATGVILWQKKTVVPTPTPTPDPEPAVVEDGFPKLIPVLNNKYIDRDKIGISSSDALFNAYLNEIEPLEYYIETGSSYSLSLNSNLSGVRSAYAGDVISFPYVNNKDEGVHVLTKGHSAPVNCYFEWARVDKTKVSTGVAKKMGATSGKPTSAEVPDLPDFLTMEKASENSVVIKSIKSTSEYSSYLSALNAKYPYSSFPKANFPYFMLSMLLIYYSSSLGIGFSSDKYVEFRYFLPR